MELNIYQKTDKHRHSLFFNRIAVKIHLSSSNSNFEVMDNVLRCLCISLVLNEIFYLSSLIIGITNR